jgi:arylsulfatase A-like enzyme
VGERTNVVFIVVDTTRADHIGSYGYRRDTTPHIDRLAEKSTVFEQAYSHTPWTMPSVASLFTSLPPRDHGIVKWEQPLALEHLTLAEHLQAHGFLTAGFVSHLIFFPEYRFNQGFEHYDVSVLREGDPVELTTSREISDLAIRWLREEAHDPFFLWLHYFDPHGVYLQHEPYVWGDQAIDRYDSEIRHTDEQIGRVLSSLETLGMADDTIVVVVADHGEEFGDHGGIRHSKTLYDEVVRIPLVIYVPGFSPRRIDTIVSESDVAPTLCRLLGLPVPASFAGRAFAFDDDSFRVEEHRTVFMETLRLADKRGVRDGRWKLVIDRETGARMLFDLARDPGEKRNMTAERADVVARLERAIAEHYAQGRTQVDEHELSEPLREQLEALGYLK